jgi:threonine/homoserine/homoserine lactone efflux protein
VAAAVDADHTAPGRLGTLLERSAQAFTVVKLAGAVYLVWLGIQAILAELRPTPRPDVSAGPAKRRPPRPAPLI